MLDFSQLATPVNHGDVLVAPEPSAWVGAMRANHEALGGSDARILDSTLGSWRRKTRESIAGADEAYVIVLGHQPAFIHPGVWVKHVVAMRVAAAVDGVAINLVVDNDAPRTTALSIPSAKEGRVTLGAVEFARIPQGCTYEQIPAQDGRQVEPFERRVRDAMGEAFEQSQMPGFFHALAGAPATTDWVDQVVTARRAVEADLGVLVEDRRVSQVWCSPLLIDMLVNAERFATSYNRALAAYRVGNGVRSATRPIPDLEVGEDRCEVAAWAYREMEPRRRLFVSNRGGAVELFADRERIGEIPATHLGGCDCLGLVLEDVGDWRIRPRALTLTIWARLLLADLFIHGIGGAKYDRISDMIMADYYAVGPPHMACASATLHLDLPRKAATVESVRRLRHDLRDLRFNAQRHPPHSPRARELTQRREEAVREAAALRQNDPRNRRARRAAFDRIREFNTALLAEKSEALESLAARLAGVRDELTEVQIALGREYFFGLYDRGRLEQLLAAVPTERAFRV
jgi:hypothetical protein